MPYWGSACRSELRSAIGVGILVGCGGVGEDVRGMSGRRSSVAGSAVEEVGETGSGVVVRSEVDGVVLERRHPLVSTLHTTILVRVSL